MFPPEVVQVPATDMMLADGEYIDLLLASGADLGRGPEDVDETFAKL